MRELNYPLQELNYPLQELNYPSAGGTLRALYFAAPRQGAPLIVDIHGGGFCSGSADGDADLCARLARETGWNAVSLDYRLAPAHRYPAAAEDVRALYAALRADASLHFDRQKVVVMGHSAGANLAVALVRSEGAAGAVLNYPWLNIADNRRKYRMASIPKFVLDSFAKKYCPDRALRRDPALSPLYMGGEEAAAMPPTLVVTAGQDSLRADGIAFCKLLQGAGVGVRHIEYPAARHGFIEIAASGRMKKNFYTSEKTVQAQLGCYEQALADIICYMREIV